jgi:hypothetical protein
VELKIHKADDAICGSKYKIQSLLLSMSDEALGFYILYYIYYLV